jgi:nucleoside-diphosphate-sugar epimerase
MTKDSSSHPTVLVTGASGFIAMHCIVELLKQGYRVRGTLRDPSREVYTRQIILQHAGNNDRLDFVIANLLDEDWSEVIKGCDFVLHMASPFPFESPRDEKDLLIPAIEGTVHVLKACIANGVGRVVLTSSLVAVVRGHDDYHPTFDEGDWTVVNDRISTYAKSKTLAERAAWDFMHRRNTNHDMELTVINPGLVLGPLLDGKYLGTSAKMIRHILAGGDTSNYQGRIELVDVRDVVGAHLLAMTNPTAGNKRYCCLSNTLWWWEVINILDQCFSSRGYKVCTQKLPDLVTESPGAYKVSNERIKKELSWQPRTSEEAIIAMGESLVFHKLV